MLVKDQKVEIKWNGNNRKWFEEKGYNYTKHNDILVVDVIDLKPSSQTKVSVVCDYCNHIYETTYEKYILGLKNINKSCCNKKKCKNKKASEVKLFKNKNKQYQKFVNLCENRGYIPISKIEDYKGAHSKLKYKCPKHGIKEITLANFEKNKLGCNECGNELISLTNRGCINDYNNIIKEKHIKILNCDEYINIKMTNLKVICNNCKNIFITNLENLLQSNGCCKQCSYKIISQKNLMSVENVKNIISSKNNNILTNPQDYIGALIPNLKIKCGSCGNIFTKSLSNYKRANFTGKCPNCSPVSYGEYLIAMFLNKYNVTYTRQEHFNGECRDINPLPFDFYLPDYNLCIEFDGKYHYEVIFGEENYYKTILHDAMKNNYCKWNNISLLRIPYWKKNNIENILIETLNLKPLIET